LPSAAGLGDAQMVRLGRRASTLMLAVAQALSLVITL
jgi:hypothetical protein